jgi:hypothetical protein
MLDTPNYIICCNSLYIPKLVRVGIDVWTERYIYLKSEYIFVFVDLWLFVHIVTPQFLFVPCEDDYLNWCDQPNFCCVDC